MDYFQDQKIKIAFQILKDHGAAEVYLFGSQASGNVCRDSDYGFAVKGFPMESLAVFPPECSIIDFTHCIV